MPKPAPSACVIRRSASLPASIKSEAALAVALGLMRGAPLPDGQITDATIWEGGDTSPAIGTAAIKAALSHRPAAAEINVDEIVTHGKAAAVSGRMTPADGGRARLFCHMIRFTSAGARTVAQVVSFDHPAPQQA
ncbi:hypothetical protein [Rhodalgimonas zhirmunskyi]|uniref:SnoaL-like domain-containing protein n=1 Tax=Rhodalgimonas zhirmunskyi TaxID=2964767 RepID=A0AAJ1UCH4_9RHOB|nr:hypothetical protein [Rhodoalgimonas zhirmunskyi]MDQ2094983.1 hypothetical protein [Rhodoalgimonas zhirmunskyi]